MTKLDQWLPSFRAILDECRGISVTKLNEYGLSWSEFRVMTAVDHVMIKAMRIRKLEELESKGERPKIDEGRYSEYLGVINYAIITLILLQEGEGMETITIDGVRSRWDEWAEAATELMKRKTADYSDAWRQMAVTSFTDFIISRARRIKDLLKADGETESEGVEAQLLDTINYAVFAAMRLKEVGQNV